MRDGSNGSYLYHHYNNLGSTMKLSNASGQVVASYTYGTYGELLSGDITFTRFLYNGRCGVTTDDNGLYYMRQRYYNPEIKRFVNQDVLRGSLSNSQSLNRYSYVQGNPVSYTDPFGLSPLNGLFTGTGFAHALLGLLGCVPGPVGFVANLADAMVYAFVDKDYGMAALSALECITMGASGVLTLAAKGSKLSKGASLVRGVSNFVSNTVNFTQNLSTGVSTVQNMYERYVVQGQSLDISTVGEVGTLLLSGLGCFFSARGAGAASEEISDVGMR